MSLLQDGSVWRERGKEMRAIAGKIEDPESKRELLAIAARYEVLADHADARAANVPLSRGG